VGKRWASGGRAVSPSRVDSGGARVPRPPGGPRPAEGQCFSVPGPRRLGGYLPAPGARPRPPGDSGMWSLGVWPALPGIAVWLKTPPDSLTVAGPRRRGSGSAAVAARGLCGCGFPEE
jgi:hypothetical protein